jgi:hypothetical protein
MNAHSDACFLDRNQNYEQPKSTAGSCCSGESHS